MTTAKEAGFIPGDLAIYATGSEGSVGRNLVDSLPLNKPGVEVRLVIGRITAVNAPASADPDSKVTKMRLLWSNGDIFDRGKDEEIDATFQNFVTEDDARLKEELAGAYIQGLPSMSSLDLSDKNKMMPGEQLRQYVERTAAWHDVRVPEEEVKDFLAQDGVVEDMVASGRIPLIQNFQSGLPGGFAENMVFCILPPHGTRAGDFMERYEGGIYEFFSPKKESRGLARLLTYTPEEAAELIARIDSAYEAQKTS